MPRRELPITRAEERRLAAWLFNHTWDLLDRERRTLAESEEMIHAAHASVYHWGKVGTPLNLAVGEWQLSRVYVTLKRTEPALYHGERALQLAKRHRLAPFYLAYGHEALARVYALMGWARERDVHLKEARVLTDRVRDADDRRMLLDDLATLR